MTDDPLPYTLRYVHLHAPMEEEFDTLAEAVARARWIADAGEGAFEHIRQGDELVQVRVDDVPPVSTAQLLINSGPITMTVTPPPGSYTFALAPVLDSDWAYARAQMGLPAEPPQAPGGVYAQLAALAGHVARLQARLDTQEALLLDVTARVAALEGHTDE